MDTRNSTSVPSNGQSEDFPGIESWGEHVTIRELARAMGMDRSNTLKVVKKLGHRRVGVRTSETGSQLAAAVTREDALAILGHRKRGGFLCGLVQPKPLVEDGHFYVIQLVPDLSGRRVKLGFSANPEERLQQHRTAAPTAVLLKTWPCKRTWEIAAMDSVTREDCNLILNEVFDCDDLASLLARGDAFFDIMPTVS